MAVGKKKQTTIATARRRYSKEEVLNAILDLDSDSSDAIPTSSSDEIDGDKSTKSPKFTHNFKM